jgi:hypothetical protein
MKHIFPYYEVLATLRMASPPTKPWPEWVHVFLANMKLDERSREKFTWQFLGSRTPWSEFSLRQAQERLRSLWREAANGGIRRRVNLGELKVSIAENGSLEIVALDAIAFAFVALLRDAAIGKAGICANPECENPYFLRNTKRNSFCSHPCAVLMNVRRFRAQKGKAKK